MSITVIEMASNSLLTTRERVKAELGLTTTDDDDVISDLIVRASSAIARECRRPFGVETVLETLEGSGSRLLGLSRTPIVSVTTVLEDTVTVPATEYSIEDAEAGALYRLNGWGRSGGLRMWGTEAYASGYILPGYQDLRYSVTYRAGYLLPSDVNPYILPDTPQNLPGAVEQACIETVKAWYRAATSERSQPAGLKRLTAGSVTLEWDLSATQKTVGLPTSSLNLLRNYYAGALR